MRAVEGHASEILSASVEQLLAFKEVGFKDLADQLVRHYTRMRAFDLGAHIYIQDFYFWTHEFVFVLHGVGPAFQTGRQEVQRPGCVQ